MVGRGAVQHIDRTKPDNTPGRERGCAICDREALLGPWCSESDGAPQRYVHLETVNMTVFGKRVLNLKMSSSWLIQVGPKANDKCPYKKKRRQEKAM